MLANEKVKLNDTVGRNQYLKTEINIMRKEILYFIKTSLMIYIVLHRTA